MRICYGRGRPLRAAIQTCCLSAFLFFGYDQGVFSGILQNPDWKRTFNNPNGAVTGIIMGSYCIGALIGCAISFAFGDYSGRRRMIWIAIGFVVAGAILQTSAYSMPHLIIGRIICGIGTGIDSSTVPAYQAELCEKERRGRLVSWEVLFIGIGVVVAYWLDFGFSYLSNASIGWRTPIALQMVFAVIVIFLLWEALEVLCAVFDRSSIDPFIVEQMEEIREAIVVERRAGAQNIPHLFKNDRVKTRRRVILAWFMLFINQFSGINVIVSYVAVILVKSVGLSVKLSTVLAGCVVMAFCFDALVPSMKLDHMGRRNAMMWGSVALGICMMMNAILLSFRKKNTSTAAVAFFFLFMFSFGVTMNAVPWVYGPETLPLVVKTRGTAISVSSHWMLNFVILMATPILLDKLDWKTYLIFMCFNFSFLPIVYSFYPETSNISLEQIDKLFVDPMECDDESMESGGASIEEIKAGAGARVAEKN